MITSRNIIVALFLVCMVSFGTGITLKSETGKGNVFYFCSDKENPCASLTPDKCKDCPAQQVELGNLMKALSTVAGSLKAYSKKGDADKLGKIVESVSVLANLIGEQKPKKNSDKLDEFKANAAALSARASDLAAEAKKGKADSLQAYKMFEGVCAACHRTFR